MITVLHRGGRGGSPGTPKSNYVICARPLKEKSSNEGHGNLTLAIIVCVSLQLCFGLADSTWEVTPFSD